jgi:Na+/melibiose symporter-like transporter
LHPGKYHIHFQILFRADDDSINFISFCPPEMAGVAGSWTQVVTQTAGAVCLAVQAAIVKDINDWADSAAKSFYFMIAWTVVLCLQYLIFYRQPGTPSEEHERLRQRISEAKKEREGNAV